MSMSTAKIMNANSSTKLHQWNNLTRDYFDYLLSINTTQTHEYQMMYDRMRGPRGVFENIGIAEATAVGHQIRDFLVRCTFSKYPCSAANFTWFSSADFYNCFTFNGLVNATTSDTSPVHASNDSGEVNNNVDDRLPSVHVASSTGLESGLSLTLYIESDNGDPSDTDGPYYAYQNTGNAAGVRVTVHAPRTRPNPVDTGFDVPPGYSSAVGLSVTEYTRLGLPYGKCVSKQEAAEWNDR